MQLRLQVGGQARWNVVVSFHHKEVRSGVMAVIAFLTGSTPEQAEVRPVILGSDNELSYSSSNVDIKDDFKSWLEQSLAKLLSTWQTRV